MSTPSPDAQPAGALEARPTLPWWVAVFALALALRLLSFGEAWSPDFRDFHGLFGAFATGGPATDLAQRGLLESGGMPYQWRVDLADGSTATTWYMHHPPAFMLLSALMVRWLGVYEDALRVLPLLLSLFSVLATHRLARELAGERAARLAALLMAVVPLSARDGVQVWTEGAIAGTTALVVLHGLRWLDHRRPRDLALAALWLGLGGLLDWPAHFVLPGLAVLAVVRCRREGDWGRLWWAFLLPALSFVLLAGHKLHMVAVAGSDGAFADTGGTLEYVLGWPTGEGALAHYFGLQWQYLRTGFTPLVLALGLVGVVVAHRRPDRARAAGVWVATLPGVWYVLLFPGRSINHDFFMLVGAPGVCVAGAVGLLALADRSSAVRPALGRAALGALALAVCVWSSWTVLYQWIVHRSDEMRWLVRQEWLAPVLVDERALVVTHMGRGACLPFYSRAPVVYGTDGVEALEGFLAGIVDRMEPERRAVFLFDVHWGTQDPAMGAVVERLNAVAPPQVHEVDLGRGPQTFLLYDLPTGGRVARSGGGGGD